MNEDRARYGDLLRENRQLKRTLDSLLDELDAVPAVNVDAVREELPDVVDEEREGIQPPWEHEGYASKQDWLQDRENDQGGDENAGDQGGG